MTHLPKPRRIDRQRVSFDTTSFPHPKPNDKAKAMQVEVRERMPKREESAAFRRAVYARDLAVCSDCGLDTDALSRQWIEDVKADLAQYDCNICGRVTATVPCEHCGATKCARSFQHRTEFRAMLDQLKFPKEFARRYNGEALWHADHIVPVHEGGGGLGAENGRTLCIPCHAKVSAHQAETRALRRRHAR